MKFTFTERDRERDNNSGNGVIKFCSSHECGDYIDCFDVGGLWELRERRYRMM